MTQLEPTAGRKVFPCLDEPEYKAKFKLSIKRKSEMKSLSNTQLLKSIGNRISYEYSNLVLNKHFFNAYPKTKTMASFWMYMK